MHFKVLASTETWSEIHPGTNTLGCVISNRIDYLGYKLVKGEYRDT